MKNLIVIFLIGLSVSLNAQDFTISGTIKDAANGEDLIGATVRIKELPDVGAATNVYGFYSLSIPKGEYVIIFSSLGFEPIEKKVTEEKIEE